jgi:hypothetical protein
MKYNTFILATISIFLFSTCGIPKEDYDKLKSDYDDLALENDSLKLEIDEYENGEERLVALVQKSYNEKKYTEAIRNIENLRERHPESIKNEEFQSLLITINQELEAQKKKHEAEEKERIRLANLDKTGMWIVSYYVDDFGQPTKKGYIQNSDEIVGSFSNSATTNSALNVRFLITNSNNIDVVLYEYAGNNPVKSYGSTEYSVSVLDSDGGKHSLNATNYSDRLSLGTTSSKKMHNILLKGGRIQFSIKENRSSINSYEFTIRNSDFYENAFRKLQEK